MSQEDFNLFQQMVGDVKPLTHDIVDLKKCYQVTESQLARRDAATSIPSSDPDYLSLHDAPQLSPHEPVAFKRDGVQEGVFRKLRLGKYPIQARLDLHRKTLEQARSEIVKFIAQCIKMDIRTVIIVHGKGERANPPALMKSYVTHWLPQIGDVQCIHSAQHFHGGSGAVYVLLRKSQAQKLDNRERHQKKQHHF
jgi:DNA-nicking Smr family endonuclease